jgi:YgiT-type zinc finger domain-containing protein
MSRVYSDCFYCGGSLEEKLLQRDVWWEGRLFVIDMVPVGVCTQCGEKVVLPEVAKKIDHLLKRPGAPDREMTVPVYSLS